MRPLTSSAELKNEIALLVVEQEKCEQALKKQFSNFYSNLKPVNLFKSTLKKVIASPDMAGNVLGTALGFTAGYFAQKLVVGTSRSIPRRILGSVVQVGVTKVISKFPVVIKSIGAFLFNRVLRTRNRV